MYAQVCGCMLVYVQKMWHEKFVASFRSKRKHYKGVGEVKKCFFEYINAHIAAYDCMHACKHVMSKNKI